MARKGKLYFTSKGRHLQVVHLTHRDEEGELMVVDVELEEGPAANDLQPRQDDPVHVHVTDEDVAGDLAYVLEETEVEGLVLEPGDLQVTVDVSTVGVPVSKIPVVVLLVGRYGETAIGSDADCNDKGRLFRTRMRIWRISSYICNII